MFMKKTMLVLGLLAALGSAAAPAAEHTGWVYDGLIGSGSTSENNVAGSGFRFSDNAFSSNANIGYRWGWFGVEAGYSYFDKFKDSFTVPNGFGGSTTFGVDTKVRGWNAGVNLNHNFTENWSVQGRGGVFGWDTKSSVSDGFTQLRQTDNGTDWYAGASLDYSFDADSGWLSHSSLGLGYTYYKISGNTFSAALSPHINMWGLHSEFRF
jgi:opacity protein-like surface antigen